jgi:hypothetical protein
MLRNLINGVYDNIDAAGAAKHYQPGQLASADEAARTKMQPGVSSSRPAPLPPEVLAARALKVQPKINEVGAETLFGEDLISEKSLDEVILSYLAGDTEG